jgi:hypothetical protein
MATAVRMIAVTLAAAATGTSQARRRPIRCRTGLEAGRACRPRIGLLSARAPGGGMIAAAAVSASVSRSAVLVISSCGIIGSP